MLNSFIPLGYKPQPLSYYYALQGSKMGLYIRTEQGYQLVFGTDLNYPLLAHWKSFAKPLS